MVTFDLHSVLKEARLASANVTLRRRELLPYPPSYFPSWKHDRGRRCLSRDWASGAAGVYGVLRVLWVLRVLREA